MLQHISQRPRDLKNESKCFPKWFLINQNTVREKFHLISVNHPLNRGEPAHDFGNQRPIMKALKAASGDLRADGYTTMWRRVGTEPGYNVSLQLVSLGTKETPPSRHKFGSKVAPTQWT